MSRLGSVYYLRCHLLAIGLSTVHADFASAQFGREANHSWQLRHVASQSHESYRQRGKRAPQLLLRSLKASDVLQRTIEVSSPNRRIRFAFRRIRRGDDPVQPEHDQFAGYFLSQEGAVSEQSNSLNWSEETRRRQPQT